MDAADDRPDVLSELEDSLCRDSDVVFAVVFGSRVTGDAESRSDVDIAIKFAERLSPHERFRKRCFLAGDLQQEGAPYIDVSDVDALPIAVAHEAVTGDLLCGDETAFRRVRREIEAEFEDRRDELRRHRRDVIDRIAEDGLHG